LLATRGLLGPTLGGFTISMEGRQDVCIVFAFAEVLEESSSSGYAGLRTRAVVLNERTSSVVSPLLMYCCSFSVALVGTEFEGDWEFLFYAIASLERCVFRDVHVPCFCGRGSTYIRAPGHRCFGLASLKPRSSGGLLRAQ
jgi:hypothetical protein